MKILLVDDEEATLKALKTLLRTMGHESVLAMNGKEALDLFDSSFDIIISDYEMPEVDGYELMNRVINELKSKVPVVICTGQASVNTGFKFGQIVGKQGRLLLKPVDEDSLTNVLAWASEYVNDNDAECNGDFMI